MSRTVRITVAEPSEIIRKGVVSILKKIQQFHAEVSEVAEAEQLKNALGWQRPEILIVNPSIVTFLPLAQIRKEAGEGVKCVALQNALADAASLKQYDEVISLYDSAGQIAEKLNRLISSPETENRREALSQREKEVVVCVVKGMTNKQIADKLHLSTHTVITHRRNISAKLDIHSTAGLTIYAIVNKMIELDDIDPKK